MEFSTNYVLFLGSQVEQGHLLSDVISNLRLRSDYYQRATLTFGIKEGENLYKHYASIGYNFLGEYIPNLGKSPEY